MNFTLPPGVEVPELQRAIDRVQYYTGASAIAALCRVVREQDAMLRLTHGDHSHMPDLEDFDAWRDLLRRRVREEDGDE